jgi:hypothetical protein
MNYQSWSALLSEVITENGRVDYERLAHRRDLLQHVIEEFAASSPENDPAAFPADDDQLAYWLNAYNLFTLNAIIEEYPITSVWKARDGRFFQRRRHSAGGKLISLDDIEHQILRVRFAEPRIHFAINCGSNGCPPIRPEAFDPEGIRERLRTATENFLASEWNCRIDHEARRISISRIFKMYARDFAGDNDTSLDYRAGVIRFVSVHTGVPFDDIASYEVIYNVYDWGLNDAAREPHLGPILFHESVEHFAEGDRKLRELHLYEGNFCNRTCSWCTIGGSPAGSYRKYTPAVLDQAISTIARDGNLKFYGGEPTLHASDVIDAISYVREHGFEGLITIYSNGVKADSLIQILESDPRSEAVLNYSIYHGRDATPLGDHAKARLEEFARANPGRIFQGYKVLFHAGGGVDERFERDREASFHGMSGGCVRCFPALTTKGQFHACPFAAEIDSPHYKLGASGSNGEKIARNYKRFRDWADDVLDPAATERNISSCEMCHKHLSELPVPNYEN